MALIKTPKSNLRGKHKKFFEISLIISLAAMIAAFEYFPNIKTEKVKTPKPDIISVYDNVQSTKQETKLPPPLKPPIPIESSVEDVLNDIIFNNNELVPDAPESLPPKLPEVTKIINEDNYFHTSEKLPEPIGGVAAIQSKIVYPEIAVRAGIEGKVVVAAYVDKKRKCDKSNNSQRHWSRLR